MNKKARDLFKQHTKDPLLLDWLKLQEQIQHLQEQQKKIGSKIDPKFLEETA